MPPEAGTSPSRIIKQTIAGLLLTLAVSASSSGQEQEKVTLNLEKEPIDALINTVAEITGRNFIVDPRVEAQVTLISKRGMEADQLYQVFLSILEVHGFSAVESGDVTKIVPSANAKQLGGARSEGTGDNIVTRVVSVDNVPVAELVPILRPLIPEQAHFAAYPPTNDLILSDRASNIDRLIGIVDRVDRKSDDKVEVIELEHASASTAVRKIQELQRSNNQRSRQSSLRVVADSRTNSVLMRGNEQARLRARTLIAQMDTPLKQTGDTRVVDLQYASAGDIVEVLDGISDTVKSQTGEGDSGNARGDSGSDIQIQADESTNSLVISAPPDVQQEFDRIIQRLDVRRPQVLIEAAIAEVSADTATELGVQFAAQDGDTGIGGTSFENAGSSNLANVLNSVDSGDPVNPGSGLSVGLAELAGGTRFAALLRALASDTDTNILSTPSLTTLDNQEAEIRVGEEVPFVTGSFTGAGEGSGSSDPFQTIEREDVGVILKVTPQINEGDSVLLEIDQEVSSVTESTQAVDLITSERTLNTEVLVDDGKLIMLGGLLDEQTTQTQQKVPLLGDVPGVGRLFRYKETESTKQNLMLFLRPHIIRNSEQMSRRARRNYESMRANQLAEREKGLQLMDDKRSPVLPDLENPELPPPYER
jgi:general secretion pathway protein D